MLRGVGNLIIEHHDSAELIFERVCVLQLRIAADVQPDSSHLVSQIE